MKAKSHKVSLVIAAVSLTAVLAYMLTRSDSTSDSNVTIERADLAPQPEAPNTDAQSASVPSPTSSSITEAHADHSHGKPAAAKAASDVKPSSRLVEELPSLESYRAEAQANPHETPESIVRFSFLLTQKSESLKSESDAYAFFNELEDCMSSKEAPTSALALCLRHAQTVSAKYKALGGKYERLETSAPRKVREIISVL